MGYNLSSGRLSGAVQYDDMVLVVVKADEGNGKVVSSSVSRVSESTDDMATAFASFPVFWYTHADKRRGIPILFYTP